MGSRFAPHTSGARRRAIRIITQHVAYPPFVEATEIADETTDTATIRAAQVFASALVQQMTRADVHNLMTQTSHHLVRAAEIVARIVPIR